ncbi:caspase family protein [Labrys sp. LIt4]|uniref:caspase family protein n=1 Tax=Labrys sp. LIt4 TaxID=2821355 RepID=UPI001ADF3EF8|nr:caspase family protein [Labrys sp. LIt4]MBP0582717.1 caspase family protein [Labrys sp. LIt4]
MRAVFFVAWLCLGTALCSRAVAGPDAAPSPRGLSRIDAALPATIEGQLSYPGEGLPDDLKVCAVNLATTKETCTGGRIRLKRKGRPAGYRLTVAAGDYHVYAVSRESGQEARAYFTEFVTCGVQAGCPSHAIIPVRLAPGAVRSDVDPGDWYADKWPDAVKPLAEPTVTTQSDKPDARVQGRPPAASAEGKRSHTLLGEANQSCDAALPLLAELRSRLSVTAIGGTAVRAGDIKTLSWSVGPQQGRAPTYLMIAADAPVRVNGKGFYVLAPDAIAPFRLRQFKELTRIVIPLHIGDTARSGSLDVRPLQAGTLHLTAAITGFAQCGELADDSPRSIDLAVSAGTPEIVISDRFELRKPDQSILSPDGTRRIDIVGPRWRLIDVASGSQLSEQVGKEPRFSPTGRFVTATAEEQFSLYDAVDGKFVQKLWTGSWDLAWDDRDSFLVIGASGRGFINVLYPLSETDPDIQVGDGCRAACPGVESSAVKIDLENNLVLGRGTRAFDTVADAYARLMTGTATFRDIRNKPNNAVETSGDGRPMVYHSSINAFAAPYQTVALAIPKRWDFIDGLKFTVLGDRSYQTDAPAVKANAALHQFLVQPILASGMPAADPVSSDPIAVATRGIGRVFLPDEAQLSKLERRLLDFGLEINTGSNLATLPANAVLKNSRKPDIWQFVGDNKIQVAASSENCGSADKEADGTITIDAFTPIVEQLSTPRYKLTFFGGSCNGGNGGFLDAQRFMHDSREPGEVFDLIAGTNEDPDSPATWCPTRIGACGISGTLFFERYLVIWSRESFAAAVYDLQTRKLLHSLIRLPSPDVMERISLSNDLKTLTKIDRDGGFQILDLSRSQKSADGKFTSQSVQKPVILYGRVVDDEVVVWAPTGQFDATMEGASFVSLKLPGRQGQYTLQQYRGVLHKAGLLKEVLTGRTLPDVAIDRFPPVIAVKPTPSPRVTAEIAVTEGEVAALRIYQDGQFTDEIAVAAGARSASVDVPRLAGARWIAVVAKGKSGLYSQAATFDAGQPGTGRRRVHLISVGVDKYEDPGISQLELAASDAGRFHAAIATKAGDSVDIVSQALLTDEQASREAILAKLRVAIAAGEPGDTILLFVAGHGIQTPDGQYYLATSQTRLADIAGTALRWSDLAAELAKAKSRIAVFLDSCHSGSAGTGFFATSDSTASALIDKVPSGIVIFSAAKGRELSEEMPSQGGGVFTDALVKAMANKATDLNSNGAIEASELYAGVKGSVIKATDGRQTPWFARNDMVGDFVPF